MKNFAIAVVTLLIAAIIPLAGCEEPVTHPTSPSSSYETPSDSEKAIEKAEEAMEKVNRRRTEEQKKMEQAGDFSASSQISEKIFKDELGFEERFWTKLVNIFIEEVPKKTRRLSNWKNLKFS